MAIQLKLSRPSRIYRPSENLEGTAIIKCSSPLSHHGIRVTIKGSVNLQLGSGTVGVIESLYSSLKPIRIIKKTQEIAPPGKLVLDETQVPFSILISTDETGNNYTFFETYHGSNINIQYLITVDIMRGYLHKSLSSTIEFIIESGNVNIKKGAISPESVNFYITPDTQMHKLLPELYTGGFHISGKVDTQCSLLEPVTGELIVEESSVPIHSIDIVLLRIESILIGERATVQTSRCQITQVADGDICRGISLPIYIVLPRLLTCPGLSADLFSIEFQIQVIITFDSPLSKVYAKSDLDLSKQWVVYQTLPLRLVRAESIDDD